MSAQRLRDAAVEVRRTVDQYPPGVGLALADWLDYQAFWHESRDAYGYADTPDATTARGIADLILGGVS